MHFELWRSTTDPASWTIAEAGEPAGDDEELLARFEAPDWEQAQRQAAEIAGSVRRRELGLE